MDKIRVLHITKAYPPLVGGIETTSEQVCLALKKTNVYSQIIFSFNNTKDTKVEKEKDYIIYRIGVQLKLFSQPLSLSYKKELKRVIKEFKPEIVHFHYPNPFAAYCLKKSKYNGKLILHYHADIIKQKLIKQFFIKQTKRLLKKANVIVATSPNYLENTDFLSKYKSKVKIIPSSIIKERTIITDNQKSESLKIKQNYKDKKIIFFYGRHVEYKGIKYLIQSDEYLDNNKVQILIGGSGPLTDQLKVEASKFSNITFLGKLSDEQINSYFLACDIFAFPSITRNEALGLTLVESLFYGKPSVIFEIAGSGVNYVSLNNVTGLTAPNSDSKTFANNINTILNDEELYSKFSTNAKKRFDGVFSIDTFEKNIINLYKGIINE